MTRVKPPAEGTAQHSTDPATRTPLRAALAINLRHLRAFSAVASAGSVSGAAAHLSRVPSAVTRSVSELESGIGRPLFERRARGMSLNAHGQIVLVRAKRIEQEFEAARAQVAARGATRSSAEVQSLFASIFNGRRLAVVVRLAQTHSMSVVARAFGITQPAISTALADLEAGLGIPLFLRGARGMMPTLAGEAIALHFSRVLAELRHIGPDIAAHEGSLQGSVHVGALPLGRTLILPTAIAALIARHPGLHVTTLESPYEALAASLRSGDIDFILGALRPADEASGLQQEALFEDQLSVIARAGHPLARARRIGFEALQRATWVLSRHGSPSRELFERCFAQGPRPLAAPAVETGDLAVLRGLLMESDMLTAISAHQLRYEIRSGSLVVLKIPLLETRRQIGLTRRLGDLPSPGAHRLMEQIRILISNSDGFARGMRHR